MRSTTLMLLVVFLSSCATARVSVDGRSLEKEEWERDQQDIRSRASFELSCSADALKLQVLSVFQQREGWPNQVGVTGCDKQVVYVKSASGWVANSTSGEQAPKTAP